MRPLRLAAAAWQVSLAMGLVVPPARAHADPLQAGDVLLGLPDGKIAQYRNGTRLQGLDTGAGTGASVAGLCSSTDQDYLYAAIDHVGGSGNVYRFDAQGQVQGSPQAGGSWLSLPAPAVACVTARNGRVLVVVAGGTQPAALREYLADGTLHATHAPEGIGATRSIDLDSDQCTVAYASGGRIRQFSICAGAQLADLPGAPATGCRAVRLLENGEALVACSNQALRLSSAGAVLRTYEAALCRADRPDIAAGAFFLALDVAPEGGTFWARVSSPGPLVPGRLCSLDLETGGFRTAFEAPPAAMSTAVQGERLAASRWCFQLRGRFVCLVRYFPYPFIRQFYERVPRQP